MMYPSIKLGVIEVLSGIGFGANGFDPFMKIGFLSYLINHSDLPESWDSFSFLSQAFVVTHFTLMRRVCFCLISRV